MILEKYILNAMKYKRATEPGTLNFSASMVSNDPWQNALNILHGSVEQNVIGINTVVSLMHSGLEHMQFPPEAGTAHKEISMSGMDFHHPLLKADWLISGTADLVIDIESNGKDVLIFDYKMISAYQWEKKIAVGKESSSYLEQLLIQAKLYAALYNVPLDGRVRLYNAFFIRDAMFSKKQQVYHEAKWFDGTFNEAVAKADSVLLEHIAKIEPLLYDADEGKGKCEDVWWRKMLGVSIPSKCLWYCGVKDSCNHYKNINPSAKMIADPSKWV